MAKNDNDYDDFKQDGKWAVNTNSTNYQLPIVDVCDERRNFPGCKEYENMLPLWDTSGTTETDSVTDPAGSGGYTQIYSKRK